MNRKHLMMVGFSLALAFLTFGCGGPTAVPTHAAYVDVKGEVTIAGKPVKAAVIYFEPDGAGGRDTFADVTDGKFTTKLFVAKYKVAFDIESKKSALPSKYTKFATSDQKFEVTGATDSAKIELK